MSISITLMRNYSDINVLDKNTENLSTVSGTLKNKTSILNPVIQIQGALPTGCNYMYIADFGRYYFVDDISSVSNPIFEISAHVDVLTTYADQIRSCRGIIARQQNNWNLYVDDGAFKTYQNEIILVQTFTTGFSDDEFVLAVAGS